MPTVCGILVVAINEFSAIRPVAGPPYGRVADSRDALALGILCLTKMPFNSRRLLFATQTDGLERFPRMCRSSDRMIELQSNARPPQPSWGDRLQRVARTLRGDRFGPFRRRFAGSDGAGRRPAAAPRLGSAHFSWLKQAQLGRVLAQRSMGPRSVIVSKIASKHTTQ